MESKRVVLALALPQDSPPVRVPIGCSAPTVVANPWDRMTQDFTKDYLEGYYQNGSNFNAISRDPLHASISLVNWDPATYWRYTMWFNTLAGASKTFPLTTRGSGGAYTIEPLSIARMSTTEGYDNTLLPKTVFSNYDVGKHAIFLNGSALHACVMFITRSADVFTALDFLHVYRWGNNSWDEDFIKAGTGTDNYEFSIIESGYFAFELELNGLVTAGTTATMTVRGNSACWAIRPIPAIEALQANITGLRVNAAAMLVSERTATVFAGGTILGVQLAQGSPWRMNVDYDKLLDLPTSESFNLNQGCYVFHKPTDVDNFQMRPCFTGPVGSLTPGIDGGPINPVGGWCVVICQAPKIDGAYPGGLMQVNYSWGIEYTTSNNALSPQSGSVSTASFNAALDEMRSLKNVHENPLHWADIKNFARKGANGLMKIAPAFLSVMSKVDPRFAGIAAAFDAISQAAGAFQ